MAVGAAGCLHREQSEHLLRSGKEPRDTELGSEPETQLGSHTLQETWRGEQMLLIRPQLARMWWGTLLACRLLKAWQQPAERQWQGNGGGKWQWRAGDETGKGVGKMDRVIFSDRDDITNGGKSTSTFPTAKLSPSDCQWSKSPYLCGATQSRLRDEQHCWQRMLNLAAVVLLNAAPISMSTDIISNVDLQRTVHCVNYGLGPCLQVCTLWELATQSAPSRTEIFCIEEAIFNYQWTLIFLAS